MKLLRELNEQKPQAELTKRPSRKEIEAAWWENVLYRGVSIWDAYYEKAEGDKMVERAMERENDDLSDFDHQESYLGYVPSKDMFLAGYDTWGSSGYDDEVDETTNVMAFKMVPAGDGLRITTIEPYHTPGRMVYGRDGSYDQMHREFKDLIDIRLD